MRAIGSELEFINIAAAMTKLLGRGKIALISECAEQKSVYTLLRLSKVEQRAKNISNEH